MAHAEPDPTSYCLTSGDLSRSLRVDLKTVHRWVRRGRLRGHRTKGGHLRFRRIEVVRFLRDRKQQIPENIRICSPKVLVIGLPYEVRAGSVDICAHGLFDALLALATGNYDIAAIDLDAVDVKQAQAFAEALRRQPATEQVALLAVSRWPDRRHAMLAAGADLAVSSGRELTAAVRFISGAPPAESAYPAASAPPPTTPLLPRTERPSYESEPEQADRRALAG